jgi:hypothetical protein
MEGTVAQVVLVHGIGQQGSTAHEQLGCWLPSIVEGIRHSGHPAAGDVAAVLAPMASGAVIAAFYGDLFLRDGLQGGQELADPEAGAVAEALALALLHSAAQQADPRVQAEARSILRQTDPSQAGAQGPLAAARGAMALLDGNAWLATRIFGLAERAMPNLLQVGRYLTEEQLHDKIQDRVASVISADTRVVVAHSLGSVVAWEACQRIEGCLPALITIGSPLGLDTVVYPRLRPAPMFPARVLRWVNVAHPDDIVAVVPRLAPLFPSKDSRQVEDHAPRSAHDHHGAATYLEQADVGRAVAEALRQA